MREQGLKDQRALTEIDIGGKGMVSSVSLKSKFVIGCKDGSVFEIDA